MRDLNHLVQKQIAKHERRREDSQENGKDRIRDRPLVEAAIRRLA
jgi:hypothetical protein